MVTLGWLWKFNSAYEDYLHSGLPFAELQSYVRPAVTLSAVDGSVLIATAVVTIVWLWRVRVNAEAINPHTRHRWGRGATVWGWLPVVNFWVPRRVVLDVVGAGVPGVSASVVNWWWGTWVASLVLERMTRVYTDPESKFFDVGKAVLWTGIGAALMVVAAVFFLRIVRGITAWQSSASTYRPGEEVLPPFL
ncbi:DUF4328 domain-containing protein [Saccharothrix variisporea]|uniref:DUF4328 domain-containing protein n=1 Tax=Saccharothrix variisporea TaxID=543527 RepID=UPI0014769367|nr:DUF4328 domain-containing protein [Saccharothrix variisporea]